MPIFLWEDRYCVQFCCCSLVVLSHLCFECEFRCFPRNHSDLGWTVRKSRFTWNKPWQSWLVFARDIDRLARSAWEAIGILCQTVVWVHSAFWFAMYWFNGLLFSAWLYNTLSGGHPRRTEDWCISYWNSQKWGWMIAQPFFCGT